MICRRRLVRATSAVISIASLFLVACAASRSSIPASTQLPRATVTATPETVAIPAIQTITLPNFMASYVFPVTNGLILYGNPGTVGQPIGPAGATALYYYDNAAQSLQPVAAPTPSADGVERGIRGVVAAGDWAFYYVGDSNDLRWEIWALNLSTKDQRIVASTSPDQALLPFYGSMVTDGVNLVWSYAIPAGNGIQHVMKLYNLASGNAQTLEAAPVGTNDFPKDMANGAFVFDRRIEGSPPTDTLWLWKIGDAAPTQISTNAGLTVTMNDKYVVWDDVSSNILTLYDRRTGQENDNWVPSCIRPSLAQDRPYLVCIDFDPSTYRLVRVPSGANQTFYDNKASSKVIFIGNARAYWVATPQFSPYSNQIDYFDLPTC